MIGVASALIADLGADIRRQAVQALQQVFHAELCQRRISANAAA
jgi:hypothetical protein